ncbi:MAG: sugar phosphate isomerase/epimerase, partial [bacterium]|nr:sugar phosphate isomerase/epimerase [bacterium]
MSENPSKERIRIGTLVKGQAGFEEYIRQLLPYGFESFSIMFWQTLGNADLNEMAARVKDVLADTDVIISSLSIFGNPLEQEESDLETLKAWEQLIDRAHLFGADLVTGFTGRLRGKPIPDSIPRFKTVFGELVKRAEGQGVRLAMENCSMEGNWNTGDWNLAHHPESWEMLFDAIPSDALGLEWEPCHQLVALVNPLPQLKEWIPKIFHVHGKDATIHWDVIRRDGIGGSQQFAYHRAPGFGDTNWVD